VRSRRRLLMTTDAVGGVWTYALDLAAGLHPLGFDTTLVVLGPSPAPDQVRDAHATAGLTLVDTRLPLDWMARERAEIEEAGAAVRGLARRVGADIVHLNSPALAVGGGFVAPVIGACHSCLATWWSTVRDGPMPEDFRWRSRALWQGLVACDALVAPTAAFARATARAYDVPAPFVVHNGRSAAVRPDAAKQPVVFTSGRLWDDGKNVAALDAAAGLSGAPVYAAGPLTGPNGAAPPPRRHLQALGSLPSEGVRDWLQRASIYASSALYEPFGLGVLEAAQAGCALVLSDIATFRELWDGAAIFADPRQPEAFAAAFENLLRDQAEARRLGQLAQARADAFSVEAMSRGVAQIYDRASALRGVPRSREAAA
jgi:glycogen(starch) synthase